MEAEMPESLKEDGRPSQQWYWDMWFSSHDVQSCGLAAQGLWINLLGIMFSSEIRGTLTINGIQMDNKAIAKRFKLSLKEVNKLITELENQRVFSRLENGTIYSRRMYRESQRKEELSRIRSKAGKEGMKKRWNKKEKEYNKSNNKKVTNITASSPTLTPSPTPSLNTIAQNAGDKVFEEIWEMWPRKEDKGKAREKYNYLINGKKIDPERIKRAIIGYINCEKSKGTEKWFYKYLKSFLYGGKSKEGIPGTWEEYEKYADPEYTAKPRL